MTIGAAAALAALPFWLGPALRLIGQPLHLTFGRYERQGYWRFAVHDTVCQRNNVLVTVQEADCDTPLLWAWRHLRREDRPARARGWEVRVTASALPPAAPRRVTGITTLHPLLEKIATNLGRWLPRAEVQDGAVDWPKGGFKLRSAVWDRNTLTIGGLGWMAGSVDGQIAFLPGGRIRADAQEPDREWTASIDWTGAEAAGRATAWEQPLSVTGHYGATGWMPDSARAETGDWSLAAKRAGFGDNYGRVTGGAWGEWKNAAYEVSVHAQAEPKAPGLPPLKILAHAAGDRARFTVDQLQVGLPFATVNLDRPIALGYGRQTAPTAAQVAFSADLTRWPAWAAHGQVAGQATVTEKVGTRPVIAFAARALAAGWKRYPEGDYDLAGTVDLQARTAAGIRVKAHWNAAALQSWLPAGATLSGVDLTAQADGPWDRLTHRGALRIAAADLPPVVPVAVTLGWQGQGSSLDHFDLALRNPQTTLELSGAADPASVQLSALRWTIGGAPALTLSGPATVRWAENPPGGAQAAWSAASGRALAVTGLKLQGPSAAVELEQSANGAFSARLTAIPSRWAQTLVGWTGPDLLLDSLLFRGHWANDRLVFNADLDASAEVARRMARLTVSLAGDGESVKVQTGRVMEGNDPMGHFEGLLPVSWDRAARPHLRVDMSGPLSVSAETTPNTPFWPALAESFGVRLVHPHASLRASGTLSALAGELHVAVEELTPAPGKVPWKIPALEGIRLDAHADTSAIVLDRLTGSIAGQPISAGGRLPMSEQRWRGLASRKAPADWSRAEAHLDIAEAEIAPFAPFLPQYFAPRGHWSVHFRLEDSNWNGLIHVTDAALRPIAPLGQLQNISGDLVWHDRTVELREWSGVLGGQKVVLTGSASYPLHGAPQFALDLTAQSIPLVRRANLLIRADLDLHAISRGPNTRVTGKATVTDGLLLGDLSDLLPSGMTGGERPPPYFEVDSPLLGKWLLDVQLAADHSMRVRSSLFTGTASAQFDLTGTLQDPRAVGVMRVDQGSIALPFANFDVQVGTVRLTADDPFHPRVDVSATSRRYDYDIRMIASGPADAPILNFTSNPALPSDQVLLLVMAGQLPNSTSNGAVGATGSQVAGLGAYFGQSVLSGFSGDGSPDRLTVNTGQELSVKGKPTYEVEFKVAPRWWLVGEYDEFDDYNAGVKWRVYTKEGKKP
jgi:translocation and assembly module TamB